jgi:hypothetical protein
MPWPSASDHPNERCQDAGPMSTTAEVLYSHCARVDGVILIGK